jgi:hypothetical protein
MIARIQNPPEIGGSLEYCNVIFGPSRPVMVIEQVRAVSSSIPIL